MLIQLQELQTGGEVDKMDEGQLEMVLASPNKSQDKAGIIEESLEQTHSSVAKPLPIEE